MDIIIIDGKEYDLDAVTPEVKEELLLKKRLADEVAKLFAPVVLQQAKGESARH